MSVFDWVLIILGIVLFSCLVSPALVDASSSAKLGVFATPLILRAKKRAYNVIKALDDSEPYNKPSKKTIELISKLDDDTIRQAKSLIFLKSYDRALSQIVLCLLHIEERKDLEPLHQKYQKETSPDEKKKIMREIENIRKRYLDVIDIYMSLFSN